MGYYALKIEMSYEYTSLFIWKYESKIEYDQFKKLFGEDGSLYVIGENLGIFSARPVQRMVWPWNVLANLKV